MADAAKMDNAGKMDEFEPAALHSSRAKGSRRRVGGVQMNSEAVGNRGCKNPVACREAPAPLHGGNKKEAGCLGEGTGKWGSGFHSEWDGAGS